MKKASLLILILVAAASAASVKAGGRIFGYFSNTMSDPDSAKVGYNEFGVSRAYLEVKADFIEANKDETPLLKANAKITYDVEPLDGFVKINPDPADSTPPSVSISSVYMGFLKVAYGEIGAFRGMPGELWIRIGQIVTTWTGYEENLWRLRYVAKVMTDEYKVLNSADRGISAEYKFPSGYGSADVMYVNGEGYKSGETNEFKDMAGRISVFPLAGMGQPLSGFGIHGYYQLGKPSEDQVRNRTIAGASYTLGDKFGLMGSYLIAANGSSDDPTDAAGYSGWAWVDAGKLMNSPYSFGLFGRYDNYDPDSEAEDDASSFIIAGAYFGFAKGWQLAADYQLKKPEDPDTEATSKIYLHLLAQF